MFIMITLAKKNLNALGYHGNSIKLTTLDLHYSIKNSQFRSKKKQHKTLKRGHVLKVLQ